MSDTPRTYERYLRDYGKQPEPPTGDEMRDFARTLERELAAMTAQRNDLEDTIRYVTAQLIKTGVDCGAAPIEELARRVVATYQKQ